MQLQAQVLEATQQQRKQSGTDGMACAADNIVGTGVVKARSTSSAGGMQQLPSPRGGGSSSARPTVNSTSAGAGSGNPTQKRSRPSAAKKPAQQQESPQLPQTQQGVSAGPFGAASSAH